MWARVEAGRPLTGLTPGAHPRLSVTEAVRKGCILRRQSRENAVRDSGVTNAFKVFRQSNGEDEPDCAREPSRCDRRWSGGIRS